MVPAGETRDLRSEKHMAAPEKTHAFREKHMVGGQRHMVHGQRHMLSENPDSTGPAAGFPAKAPAAVSARQPKGASSGFRAGFHHAGLPESAPEARSPERSPTQWFIFHKYHKINDLDTKTHGWAKNTCLETHGRKTHG